MAIFNSYVKLPEGTQGWIDTTPISLSEVLRAAFWQLWTLGGSIPKCRNGWFRSHEIGSAAGMSASLTSPANKFAPASPATAPSPMSVPGPLTHPLQRHQATQWRTPALPKRHLSDHTGHVFIFLPTQREKPWIRKCSKLKGINNPDTNQSYPL